MGLYKKFYFKFKILSYKFYRYRSYAPKIYTHRKNAVLRYCLKLPPIHVIMHEYRSPKRARFKISTVLPHIGASPIFSTPARSALYFRTAREAFSSRLQIRTLRILFATYFCANAQLTLALYFAQISPRRSINPV